MSSSPQPSLDGQPQHRASDGLPQPQLQPLLERLRGRLDPRQRQTTLDQARPLLSSSLTSSHPPPASYRQLRPELQVILDVIEHGPNDARRLALQSIAAWLNPDHASPPALSQDELEGIFSSLLHCTNRSVRKGQQYSSHTPNLATLSPSSLRTAASALKAIHALLASQTPTEPSSSVNSRSSGVFQPLQVTALMDTLLVTMYLGAHTTRGSTSTLAVRPTQAASRPSFARHTGLQFGALSFQLPSRAPQEPGLSKRFSSTSLSSTIVASDSEDGASMYNTDASTFGCNSDSEPSPGSAGLMAKAPSQQAAAAVKSGVSPLEQEKKRETATRAIRLNSLHCLIPLTRSYARQLYSYWDSLLPASSGAATIPSQTTMSVSARTSGSAAPRIAQPSLFTLIDHDPVSSIRLTAIEALSALLYGGQSHLAMAQQRNEKLAAFTSLSAKVGSLIVHLREHLASLLQSLALGHGLESPDAGLDGTARRSNAPSPSSYIVATLRLTKTFAINTSRARLLVSNAEILQPLVFRFCSSKDPHVSSAAYEAVSALMTQPDPAGSKAGTKPPASGSIDVLTGLVAKLDLESASSPARVQIWRTMSVCIGSVIDVVSPALLKQTIHLCGAAIRAAKITPVAEEEKLAASDYLVAFLAAWSDSGQAQGLPCCDAPIEMALSLVGDLCQDSRATIRKLAANALPHSVSIQAARAAGGGAAPHWLDVTKDRLRLLMRDEDESVRAEGVRALGLIISDAPKQPHVSYLAYDLDGTIDLLVRSDGGSPACVEDPSLLVRQRGAWTLGNLAESLSTCTRGQWRCLAATSRALASDEAPVAVGAMRAIGCLLAVWSPAHEDGAGGRALTLALLGTLCTGVRSGAPKLRWNAASALERSVRNVVLVRQALELQPQLQLQPQPQVVMALCDGLRARIFKVKLSCAQALLVLLETSAVQPVTVAKDVQEASESLEAEIEAASFKEASLYAQTCRRALARLLQAVDK